MSDPFAVDEYLRSVARRVDGWLDALLASRAPLGPADLWEAIRYAALGGGKRLRPALVLASAEARGGDVSDGSLAARFAVALELVHTYSLVHDDLPCMDDDVLRRGRPTCHVEYDEPTALLVGDSLQTLAFEILARQRGLEPARQLEMVRLLAVAAGSNGMAGGQAIDLESVGKPLTQPELELMHALKTGALIRAAILLGALCGKAMTDAERDALDRFAKRAGLLFQVVDDILDCTASTATLGKTAGKDAAADKPTYVSLLGLEGARRFAGELEIDALDSLAPFGARAQRLTELAAFIAHRKF